MTKKSLSKDQQEYLRELGLSKHAIRLYDLLLDKKRLTASQAAGNNFASAQYRLFYTLEEYGLIRRIAGRPVQFEAILPKNGLPASYALKQAKLKQLLTKNLSASEKAGGVQIQLLVGRQAMYDEYARLAVTTQYSIREYTIGIAYSEKFVKILRAAIKRGVKIQMVAQQLKPSNYHALHKWQKIGMHVRLQPSERGFHIMLFDEKIAIITFSNPANTDERLSILTDNKTVVHQFERYFAAIWHNAREINV